MGHYNGPKARVNRRLNAQVYEENGAIKAFERRSYPPGMHNTRRGKASNYGVGLNEKQKIKHYYGIRERQLRRYFDIASRMPGNTGENLLLLCERRLDNVIRRGGLAHTRPQARQGITHWHFKVNGVKVSTPSILVRPGDIITVRDRANLQKVYREVADASGEPAAFLLFEPETLRIIVAGYPSAADISLPVEVGLVVEHMSR